MAKELNEDTNFKISLKTLAGIAVAIFTIVGMWFALQAEDFSEIKKDMRRIEDKIDGLR